MQKKERVHLAGSAETNETERKSRSAFYPNLIKIKMPPRTPKFPKLPPFAAHRHFREER
jgi:hypothetical protein